MPLIHPDDSRFPYAVNVKKYSDARASAWSQHKSLSGAIRAARSIIAGRKHRVKDLETCLIWDKRNNASLSVSRAEQITQAKGE